METPIRSKCCNIAKCNLPVRGYLETTATKSRANFVGTTPISATLESVSQNLNVETRLERFSALHAIVPNKYCVE